MGWGRCTKVMGSEPPHQPLSARAGCVALWIHHAQRLLCVHTNPSKSHKVPLSCLCSLLALRTSLCDWLSVSISTNQCPSTPEGPFSHEFQPKTPPPRVRPGFPGNATNSHIVASQQKGIQEITRIRDNIGCHRGHGAVITQL